MTNAQSGATKQSIGTLYQYEVCPFCHKVRAVLDFKGLSYDKKEVNPMNKKEINFSEDYKKVPIWVDKEGKQVNDSNAIMRHVDGLSPEKAVFATEESAQALENQWMDWSDTKLVRALPPLIYKSYPQALNSFKYITSQGNFSWFQRKLIKYMGAGIMTLVARKSAKSQGITDPELHLKGLLLELGGQLEKTAFVGGEKPCGADLSIFGVLKSVATLPAFALVRANQPVIDWYQKVEAQI